MAITNKSDVDSAAARQIWDEFQRQHDLSGRAGQTAGIDPVSGRVWLGDSIEDVVGQRDMIGCEAPLYFVRVGSSFYYRKGARR